MWQVDGCQPHITTSASPSFDAPSPSSLSSALDSSLSPVARHDRSTPRSSPSTHYTDPEKFQRHQKSTDSEPEIFQSTSEPSISSPEYDDFPDYRNDQFNPVSMYNPFPPLLPSVMQPHAVLYPNYDSYLGPVGEQYSQYLHAPYIPQQPLQMLSQEQQIDLMENLENTGLGKR